MASNTPPDILAHALDHVFRDQNDLRCVVALDCIGAPAVYAAVKAVILERLALAHHIGEYGLRVIPHCEEKDVKGQIRTAVILRVAFIDLQPA